MKVLAAAAAATLFLFACTTDAAPPTVAEAPALDMALCPGPAFAEMEARAQDAGLTWIEMSDDARTMFLANYNAIPPVSDLSAARVGVFAAPGNPVVLLVMADANGCVTAMGEASALQVEEMATRRMSFGVSI
ncbi:MAG: hypothetical protein A3E78_12095 [Alphaproteobacteria bacterium RIFCSPHIGHO2_12_FULL_63_12]|nr:MAG: hypothetical protein A3E78_12095 [Alphaproteobacteria bacterium RIFCSPHIGHO2_12_FULL_63_12]